MRNQSTVLRNYAEQNDNIRSQNEEWERIIFPK